MNEMIEKMIAFANNTNIQFETFYTIIDEMIQLNRKKNQVKDAFDNIDFDEDGYISSIDLRIMMRKLGISLNNDEIKDMMQAAAAASATSTTTTNVMNSIDDHHHIENGKGVSGRRRSTRRNADAIDDDDDDKASVELFDWQTNKIDFNQFKAICNIKDSGSSSSSSRSKRMAEKKF